MRLGLISYQVRNFSLCRDVESSWNVMAHCDVREGKWRGNWRMEWVSSTLHTNSEHGVSSITTAGVQPSAVSSRLNWCPRRFKWTRPFRRRTKSGFCACAITFQTQSTRRPQTYSKRKYENWKYIQLFTELNHFFLSQIWRQHLARNGRKKNPRPHGGVIKKQVKSIARR